MASSHVLAFALLAAVSACSSTPQTTAKKGTARPVLSPQTVVQRIAFGSCAQQSLPQPIWKTISNQKPDLFIFMGDTVYADSRSPEYIKAQYEKLESKPEFRDFVSQVPLIATWDDHDYGENDGGADYPIKAESQQLFLDFLREPQDSTRRKHPGVYESYFYGPAGSRVQIILMDTRYFRGPLKLSKDPKKGRYVPNPDPSATMLGEAQWKWIEAQLRLPADLRILVSSIQVLPVDHGWEKWSNLPHDRKRLFDLIQRTGAEGLVVLSGDRHLGAFSRMIDDLPYPLYEVTSSGLTHPMKKPERAEANRYRIKDDVFEYHFGWIEVDWAERKLELGLRGMNGKMIESISMPLDSLKAKLIDK